MPIRTRRAVTLTASGALATIAAFVLTSCGDASSGSGGNDSSGESSASNGELYGQACADHPDFVARIRSSSDVPLVERSAEDIVQSLNRIAPFALEGYNELSEKHTEQIQKGVELMQNNIAPSAELSDLSYSVAILDEGDEFIRGDDFDICVEAGETSGVNLNKYLNNYHGE